jgi:hypothetical protein
MATPSAEMLRQAAVAGAAPQRAPRRVPLVVWILLVPGVTLVATLISVIGLIAARLSGADAIYVGFGQVLSVCLWILAGVAGLSCAVGAWHCLLALHKWIRTGLAPWQHPDD